MELNEVTVIVPTRNEEHNITAFLGSIPESLALIVVDTSQDSTPDLITSLRPARTLVLRHSGTVTEARQLGADAALTPWLLFSDADIVFAPDYFDRLVAYSGYDAIYGPKLSTDQFVFYYRWFARGQHLSHLLGIPAATGSSLLVSRHALRMAGGFDLRLTCNEDSELVWRLKRKGCRISFAPDLFVYARDHRRLRRGLMRKTLHSITRCMLLYCDLMPARWRNSDWGYWEQSRNSRNIIKKEGLEKTGLNNFESGKRRAD